MDAPIRLAPAPVATPAAPAPGVPSHLWADTPSYFPLIESTLWRLFQDHQNSVWAYVIVFLVLAALCVYVAYSAPMSPPRGVYVPCTESRCKSHPSSHTL